MESTKKIVKEAPDSKIASNFSNYGQYTLDNDLELNLPDTKIKFSKIGERKFSYRRVNSRNESVEKVIVFKTTSLTIELAPALPVHLPAYKTDYMFLRLATPIHVCKTTTTDLDISVPIEVGIFGIEDETVHTFDYLTCPPSYSKYGLYGQPEEGKLCKYAKVTLFSDEKVSAYSFAKMKLHISNELERGVSIGRIVFPITEHDIYYSDAGAVLDSLSFIVKDRMGKLAEVTHKQAKLEGWKKAPRDAAKTGHKYSMENGFD